MMNAIRRTIVLSLFCLIGTSLVAQPPFGKRANPSPDSVGTFMKFDTNNDGKVTREELTDKRFSRMFDRADRNKDGIVSKEEIVAFFKDEEPEANRGSGKGGFGKGGIGKGGFGKGDIPPEGGFGFRPPRPGEILPSFMEEMLELTAEQKKAVSELQKEVDAKLEKILTEEQKKQLKAFAEMRLPFDGPPDGGDRPQQKRGLPAKKQ